MKTQCPTHPTVVNHMAQHNKGHQKQNLSILRNNLLLHPIPHRIGTLPPPRILTHFRGTQLRFPSQQILCLLWIGIQFRYIPRPSFDDFVRYRSSCRLPHSLDQFQYRDSVPGTEIDRLATYTGIGVEFVEGGDVSFGEVDDVDVITDTGAVGGVVIVSEDGELLASSYADLSDEGHEIVGYALWILPHPPRRMRPNRIKIS
mmetsp:Transcript_36885/g.62758  ORF Transcript_36885/g.62758 Transcript_36885/m.62758 type:complete len:202 (-) Transcript_36885:163-768(-)